MPRRHPRDSARWTGITATVGEQVFHGAFRVADGQVEVVGGTETREAPLAEGEPPLDAAGRLLMEIAAASGPEALAQTPSVAGLPTKPPNNLVGLAVLAAFLAAGAGLVLTGVPALTFLFVLAGWVLAVMAHEFAHAATAYLGGDHTVAAKGYLAFDPRRYADLGTSLVIPVLALALGGIGFPGGAVWLRTDLMRNPFWRAAASIAGPLATFAVLLLLATIVREGTRLAGPSPLFDALALLAFLQATALILNILPLPGLDGFNAIRPFLPKAWTPRIAKIEGAAMGLLLIAMLVIPGVGATIIGAGGVLATGLGVPPDALQGGWRAFHFWRAG
jgi:Zn-dependent protease